MIRPISRNRMLESLKEAAGWPGAGTGTLVTLAAALVAARADAEGSSYFRDLSNKKPADATALALAGFFEVRAGHEVTSAMDRLDAAATMDVGLPQYFRGLALAELLPGAGPPGEPPAAQDTWRAEQITADLGSSSRPVTSSRPCCSAPRTRRWRAPTGCSGAGSRRVRRCDGRGSARSGRTGRRCSRASR